MEEGRRTDTDMRMRGTIFTITAFLMITALCIATYERNLIWRDHLTLLEDNVRKSPDKGRVHNNLGSAYQDQGMIDQAIEQYRLALKINPTYAEAYYNLGRAYLVSDKNNDAVFMFTNAIALKSDYPDAYINLAAAYIQAKRFYDAVQLLETFAPRIVDRPDAHFNLGVAYFRIGNIDAAGRELDILRLLDTRYAVQLEQFMSEQDNKSGQNY
jgi:tetratricopeptide (TPR) repeat protein